MSSSTATARRHLGSYLVTIALLFMAGLALDAGLVHFGWRPVIGCYLESWIYAFLGHAVPAVGLTIGALCLVLESTRAVGVVLMVGAVVAKILPAELALYLGPLCH